MNRSRQSVWRPMQAATASFASAVGRADFEGYAVVRLVLGLALIAAALLKGYGLSLGSFEATAANVPRYLQIAFVEVEFLLGAWLLSGYRQALASKTAVAVFVFFFGIAFDRTLGGNASCGCFGPVRIPPVFAVVFDLIAVAALVRWLPDSDRPLALLQRGRTRTAALASLIGIGAFGGIAMASYSPAELTDDGRIRGYCKVVAVRPDEWVGRELALLPHVDCGHNLARGQWVVVFHNHGCGSCRRAIPQFKELASEFSLLEGAPRIALIEVPPYAVRPSAASHRTLPYLEGHLSDTRYWGMPLPSALKLSDGKVTQVTSFTAELMASTAYRPSGSGARGQGILPDYSAARKSKLLREVACGPLSLITVLNRLGVNLSDSDREMIVASAGSKGTDMGQLKMLSEQFGVHALGADLSIGALRELDLPAIAFVRAMGFAAITDYSASGLEVVYPSGEPRWIDDKRFQQDFGKVGRALLMSKSPIALDRFAVSGRGEAEASPVGPLLRLSKSMLAVGRIYQYRWKGALTLHNDGDEPLELQRIDCPSGAVTALLGKQTVPPGASTSLTISGREASVGSFTQQVVLTTNSRAGRATRILVRGYVDYPVFFPRPMLMLESVLANATSEATVPLELADDVAFESLKCQISDSPNATAEAVQADTGEPILRIRWHGARAPGWHRFRADVSQDDVDGVPACVDVAVHVVPLVEARPSMIWISHAEVSSEALWDRRVIVEQYAPGKNEVLYRWSDDRFATSILVTRTVRRDQNALLHLTPANHRSMTALAGSEAVLSVTGADNETCDILVRIDPLNGAENTDVSTVN